MLLSEGKRCQDELNIASSEKATAVSLRDNCLLKVLMPDHALKCKSAKVTKVIHAEDAEIFRRVSLRTPRAFFSAVSAIKNAL